MQDMQLWQRISTFSFDAPGTAFTFADRLAQENGWSRDFAREAIEEYRRFIYLAMTGERPSTPSDIVDQVWHLHLTFTRSYWDVFCGETLGRALHHGPTQGGPAEDARYRAQYDETLQRYHAAFGHPAPRRFWPPAEVRFSGAPHMSWVDRRRSIVIDRAGLRQALVSAGAVGLPVTFAGTALAATDRKHQAAPLALVAGGALLAMLLVYYAVASTSRGGKRRDGDGSGDGGVWFGDSSGKDGGHGSHGGHGGHGGHGDGGGGHGGDGGGGGCSGGCGGGGGCGS